MRPNTAPLVDLGKADYMISTLQCLANTAPIKSYFLSGEYQTELNTKNPMGSGGAVTTAFAKLMKEMWTAESGSINPQDFKTVFGEYCSPRFSGNQPHDAFEFTVYLVDVLSEDTNRVTKKPYTDRLFLKEGESDAEAARKAWETHLMRENSHILNIVTGQVKRRVQCKGCDTAETAYDPFRFLDIPVPTEPASLLDCIDSYCAEGTLPERYCCECKDFTEARQQLKPYIREAQAILIVHLQRAPCMPKGREMKLNTMIDFPLEGLDLSSRVLNEDDDSSVCYDCYAVINHHGELAGYYYAHVLNEEGVWCRYDDSRMTVDVSLDEVVTEDAYILFYRRRDSS